MLTRIKFFICLLVLQCPSTLLIPLAQQDSVSESKANNLLVLGSIEQISPNISKANDFIHQIDVKDVANQVISKINNVVAGDESIDTLIPGLYNPLANETQPNTLNNDNDTNTLINEINTVSNGTEFNENGTSNLVLNITKNVASLNNNESTNLTETTILFENFENGAPTVEPLTLKPQSDTPNKIIDVKFRRSGFPNQDNNTDDVYKHAADNNSSLESSPVDNVTLANSNNTVKPAFRMLLQEKLRKLKEVSNIVTESNDNNKDLNFFLKLLPETPPLTIDLNQLPLNNLIGGALSFMKRLKRHVDHTETYSWKSSCKFKKIDGHKVWTCKEKKDLIRSTRKSLDDNISKILKQYNSDDYLLCPLSVTVKLLAQQVLDAVIESNQDGLLKQILTSFWRGEENTINLVTKELPYLPIPVNLSLQLVHGKIKDFIGQLSDFIDATLCAL